jgi:hypothetical protein
MSTRKTIFIFIIGKYFIYYLVKYYKVLKLYHKPVKYSYAILYSLQFLILDESTSKFQNKLIVNK